MMLLIFVKGRNDHHILLLYRHVLLLKVAGLWACRCELSDVFEQSSSCVLIPTPTVITAFIICLQHRSLIRR